MGALGNATLVVNVKLDGDAMRSIRQIVREEIRAIATDAYLRTSSIDTARTLDAIASSAL